MGLFCMPKNLGNSSKEDLIEAAIKNLELFQRADNSNLDYLLSFATGFIEEAQELIKKESKDLE